MPTDNLLFSILAALFGIVIGSFTNVLICRIPKKEEFVRTPSHCTSCGHRLAWFDLIPLLSYLLLRGRCRYCKKHISAQYPLVEAANGALYALFFYHYGLSPEAILFSLASSALVALSVIDWRTYEIPVGFNYFLFGLGVIRVLCDLGSWPLYLIGFFAVSAVLALIYYLSGGRAIGGGDVKLMASCGLLLGWKCIILALAVGCIVGSVIHLIRMRFANAPRLLAMGPYLSVGILFSALYGNVLISWYLSLLAF